MGISDFTTTTIHAQVDGCCLKGDSSCKDSYIGDTIKKSNQQTIYIFYLVEIAKVAPSQSTINFT